jgi:transcriptional regulator
VLIHPWDAVTRKEWQAVLAEHDFGQLVTAGHVDGFPVVVPTHFHYDGDSTVLLHLARPNPVWRALERDPHVVLTLAADWAYVEAAWNADGEPELGVPTSYYAAVQLLGTATVVDDPAPDRRHLIRTARPRRRRTCRAYQMLPSPVRSGVTRSPSL